ncbi:MAG TPA: hypothetical protein VEA59_02125 [Patescibacteria group bacterium]|nr:hypothetical protein [Patescibacteria group bacterium]
MDVETKAVWDTHGRYLRGFFYVVVIGLSGWMLGMYECLQHGGRLVGSFDMFFSAFAISASIFLGLVLKRRLPAFKEQSSRVHLSHVYSNLVEAQIGTVVIAIIWGIVTLCFMWVWLPSVWVSFGLLAITVVMVMWFAAKET